MIDVLESAITSPWVYLALFAIAVLDGFSPVVPSETMVITAGVFAAGAFVGDHISYGIGRRPGPAWSVGSGRAADAARRSTGPPPSSPSAVGCCSSSRAMSRVDGPWRR